MKDPEIKLFGRKIVLPENGGDAFSDDNGGGCDPCLEVNKLEQTDEDKQQQTEELQEQDDSENPNTPSMDEDIVSENHQKNEDEESDAKTGQQKASLKKPDKILPCPRCNSMDTKFCYYNNYNVSQPRHFCKSCQRYWTAGGTMRNVPVGAGRRKSKNSTSHCHHITISEALDATNGFNHSSLKPNGTILSFGCDSPLGESMASSLNLAHKRENGDECSIGGVKNEPQTPTIGNMTAFPSPVPWPIPWNPVVPLPAMCPPVYPMTFYPTPYWNYGVPNWNIPLLPDQKSTSPTTTSRLGKHSRNGELLKPKTSESSVLVPKTLRIDDPEEAAKSSIWKTLGIKCDSVSREGLFKALQSKGDEKKLMVSPSSVLQANPAALSRSISFREGV